MPDTPVLIPTSAVAAGIAPPVNPRTRSTTLELLHPEVRARVAALIADLKAAGVPMKIFEAYRPPERQAWLFAQGRTRPGAVVTKADAWHSYHQYGLAVDMVIDHPDHGMWDTGSAKTRAWWADYHELAEKNDLEPLSFELPHVQLKGVRHSQLLAGEAPGPGDAGWEANFVAAIERWDGAVKPPVPSEERPPIVRVTREAGSAVAGIDWAALPKVPARDWTNRFGGQEWRIDAAGVYLRGAPDRPQRTPGDPMTMSRALDLYADAIGAACQRLDLPPELILMTIGTETGFLRRDGFTGPKSFRWEPHVRLTTTGDPALDGKERGDYSAGPMQILSNTARDVNTRLGLGFKPGSDLKWFKNKPNAAAQKDLGLYRGAVNIPLGAGFIHLQRAASGLDPVLVAAGYNAGSIRASGTNVWKIHVHGDHLDRAVSWFGDACAVMAIFRDGG